MKPFEESLKKDLIEIDTKLKDTDNQDLIFQLKKDRKYILNYLCDHINLNEINLNLSLTKSKDEIAEFIVNNQMDGYNLYGFLNLEENDETLGNLFNEFIKYNEFGLKKIYNEAILNDRIEYTKGNGMYNGRNIFISSLEKNYIEIIENKKVYEHTCLIHELGHAKINLDGIEFPYIKKNNSFLESYPIFLELVFSEYLKNNDKEKEAYQLKFLVYNEIRNNFHLLYNKLSFYLNYDQLKINYKFEKKYKELKGELLALYLYYLYLENPIDTLKIINEFIKNVKKLDDDSLIKKFNINQNCFSNENPYKLYNELKKEIVKIKIKSRK